ncbi:hypothetical protein Fmac_005213 [Flemingia macrophylla]|uniref:Receptor-like serine/threonine-protein kinase n=1 Tax=Flemingia macrophylla TaxID=520843 RepID=A0ABD1N7I0_9FABA
MRRGGVICLTTLLTLFPTLSISSDTLTPSQSLPTNQTLLSPNAIFELGIFSFTNTTWYLGIWYHTDRTIVWVANRDTPLRNNMGFLKITHTGSLLIVDDQSEKPIWSTNETNAKDPILQLLDSGNLVLKEASEESVNDPTKFLWQSFDWPTDTLLPGMKLGWNLDTGVETHITSWSATNEDPSSGDFSFKLEYRGLAEFFLWEKKQRIYRSGPWNGERFSGVPEMQPVTDSIKFTFFEDQHQVYYTFSIDNQSLFSRLSVSSQGELRRLTWIESRRAWNNFWYAPKDQCDGYGECGPYGICDTNASPVCQCVRGFRPRNQQAWALRDGSDGCLRITALACPTDAFLRLPNLKLPDTTSVLVNRTLGLPECRELCRRNCSCTAYANVDVRNGGTGCVMWLRDLFDLRRYPSGGQDLYVRLAPKDLPHSNGTYSAFPAMGLSPVCFGGNPIDADGKGWRRCSVKSMMTNLPCSYTVAAPRALRYDLGVEGGSHETNDTVKEVGIIVGAAAFILLALCIFILWKKRKLQCILKGKTDHRGFSERSRDLLMNEGVFSSNREQSRENNMEDLELLEGQDIAVKRLSKTSGQGIEEFKNEVKLIVKLQHRNLVRLLGCSIQMDEKMLVYEYMENRSLDAILFDKAKRSTLDWQRRFNIICGIARGLLYLHQDSRFRIIHRDLKASNILLDKEMNPKISDFGMARIFGTDQTEANTVRVVGTYGYMSPEYAMDGIFSVKSDIFSFGVLVLEIISGKKNRGFYYANKELNLLGHAWRVWKEGKALELIDSSIGNSYSPSEVHRCIQAGLLCVQERAEDRPTMSSVVLMLSSDTASMPQPKNPGFCLGRNPMETDSSSSKQDESCSVNHVTVTMLDAR